MELCSLSPPPKFQLQESTRLLKMQSKKKAGQRTFNRRDVTSTTLMVEQQMDGGEWKEGDVTRVPTVREPERECVKRMEEP